MRFTLPAVVAALAADATSAAPGRLREGGPDEDRRLQGLSKVGGGFADVGWQAPSVREDAPSYTIPDSSARSDALPFAEQSVIATLSGECAKGEEARCCYDLADKHGTTLKNVLKRTRNCVFEKSRDGRSGVNSYGGADEPEVASVTENMRVYAMVNSWGLDRVNQKEPDLDNQAEKVNAAGTRVYILDTGVRGTHSDFAGLMSDDDSCHANYSDDGHAPKTDFHGHGTHVASTACGLEYGVAKDCEICAVQVLTSLGSGTFLGVLQGIDHVADTCPPGKTCVANLSLGAFGSALNAAVNTAVDDGMVMVVAAGNSEADACNYTPAGAEKAITVGSTTKEEQASSFSNYGDCVDIYDPGSLITAAWIHDDGATKTISGTSMASPHVAGIAAGAIGEGGATTPDEVRDLLRHNWANPGIDTRASAGEQGLATTFYDSLAPTPPAPPALVVAHAHEFTFTPVSACLSAGALEASGTTPGQCAQACAVLADCAGFEVVRTATEDFDEGDCVLSDAAACAPDNGAAWYYARSVGN